MSSRYGVGPYSVNAYSAATVLAGEGTMVGAYTVTNARGSVAVNGVALFTAAYLLSAEAKILAGASSILQGEFSVYAEPRYATQQYGEALLPANFSISAPPSVVISGIDATVEANFEILMEWDEGKFWRPDDVTTDWVVRSGLSDIWVKEPDVPPVWRN